MIIAIDTETYQPGKTGALEPKLGSRGFILGCAITQDGHYSYFDTPNAMWEWLTSQIKKEALRGHNTAIYAHNHAYDFYGYAQNHLLDEEIRYYCFNPFIAYYDCNKRVYDKKADAAHHEERQAASFLDLHALYPMSLEEIGKAIKCSKLEMPSEVTSIEELKPYIYRDTEIVLKAVQTYKDALAKLGIRPQKLVTAGSLSKSAFQTLVRKEGLGGLVLELEDDKEHPGRKKYTGRVWQTAYENVVRQAYRGGRCEAFKTGRWEDGVTEADMNAAYPWAMMNMPFPDLRQETRLEKPLDNFTPKEIFGGALTGVIECTVELKVQPRIPLLQIRYDSEEYAPRHGLLTGTWTLAEVGAALERGYKMIDAPQAIVYPITQNPFKPFMEKLYTARKDAPEGLKVAYKLLMNSQYGKWGQYRKSKEYKLIRGDEVNDYEAKGWKYQYRQENSPNFVYVKEGEYTTPKFANPIISALTTATQRVHLQKTLERIPLKDLLYCDTDNAVFLGKHLDLFKLGSNMGEWKVVDQDKDAMILGEKRYYCGEKVRASGITKPKTPTETAGLKAAMQQHGNAKRFSMISLPEAMRMGNIALAGDFKESNVPLDYHAKKDQALPERIVDEDWHVISDKLRKNL